MFPISKREFLRMNKKYFLCLTLLFAFSLTAQEKEKPAESGAAQDLRSQDYNSKVAEINQLEARIRDQQIRMKDLLQTRKNIKDNDKNTAAMEEIKTIHKELNKNIIAFNKATKELRYRFPDEGILTERKYIQLQEKTINQIEEEIGLSTDLKRLRAKVDKKYKPFAETEEEKAKLATPKTIKQKEQEQTEENPEPKLRLSK